jgi:crotonobetainyl-CoA:carnitine CoA-transferase CaiB-like acyl-CoA transferase
VAGGQSSYFVWLNRGKESVTIDLANAAGKARLSELISTADVLVQNLKPGALARLGFAPETLRERYPRLIICSVSGYGDSGPMAGRKAYDLLIQAEAGLASVTGGPEAPARVGISVVDIATGATAHAAILEALIGRSITGEGANIRVSMFDVMADWLTVPLLFAEGGCPPSRIGLAHPSIAPYGVFTTADRRQMLLSIQSDREWAQLARTLLRDETYISDPRFSNNVQRVRNREQTDALVAAALAALTEEAASALLSGADLAFATVNDMEGLSGHPQLRRISVETPGGTISYPAPAPIVDGQDRRYGAVPALAPASIAETE